jgi:hypothetical protein
MSSHQVKIEREEEEKITYWVPLPILREGEEVEQQNKQPGQENQVVGQDNKGQDRQIKINIEQQGFRSKQGEDIFPRKRKSDFHQ